MKKRHLKDQIDDLRDIIRDEARLLRDDIEDERASRIQHINNSNQIRAGIFDRLASIEKRLRTIEGQRAAWDGERG